MSLPRRIAWVMGERGDAIGLRLVAAELYPRSKRSSAIILVATMMFGAIGWGLAGGTIKAGLACADDSLQCEAAAAAVFVVPLVLLLSAIAWGSARAFRADVAMQSGTPVSMLFDEAGLLTEAEGSTSQAAWPACRRVIATPDVAVFLWDAFRGAWVPASAFADPRDYAAVIHACLDRLSSEARAHSKIKLPKAS